MKFTGYSQENICMLLSLSNSFFIFRSVCLTKIYCSAECASADKAAHKHCCGDDPLGSDPRKWKLEREEQANRDLKKFKQIVQENVSKYDADIKATLSEVLSNFKELKVEKKSEVD